VFQNVLLLIGYQSCNLNFPFSSSSILTEISSSSLVMLSKYIPNLTDALVLWHFLLHDTSSASFLFPSSFLFSSWKPAPQGGFMNYNRFRVASFLDVSTSSGVKYLHSPGFIRQAYTLAYSTSFSLIP